MTSERTQRALASLALLFGLAACGGGGSGSPAAPPPAGLNTATITGTLLAPDGTTPLANALVYVEGSEITRTDDRAQPLAVPGPEVCGTPPTAGWSYTCSAADGSFAWDGRIPANAKLVAVKGAFRIEQTLSASGGAVALGNLLVPTGTSAAARMAVVTGDFDRVEDVLAKLGFGTVDGSGQLTPGSETFDLFDGNGTLSPPYQDADALFQNDSATGRPVIFNYAIVFINCGTEDSSATDPTRLEILRNYVQEGGRLYVSDLAYDFVEQAFPGYIDFEGSAGTAAATAEVPNQAELGTSGITSDATLDPALQAWLGGVTCGSGGSCLNGNGTATIEGFLSGWAVMTGAHANPPSSVRVWVQGPVTFDGQTAPVQRPLTVGFAVGNGRVTFTSYHNEPFGATGFVPVERILQFLVFEL